MNTQPPIAPSGRELEVLAAVEAGLSNAQIASRLHISVRTVEGHVSSLLRKYGVASRADLSALVASGPAGGALIPGTLTGLPSASTSFVGRVRERARLAELLTSERLVTLVGPGGIGKTRLATVAAAEVAAAYPFGGAFVDLVPAQDSSVPQAVAAALQVTQCPGQPLEAAIVARLARGRTLLVLDNCEHVVDAVAAFVDTVLAAGADATILATSRERLAIQGELVYSLGPLPLNSDAEQLFADRAAAVVPGETVDPAVVTELCARLDGLPLAIELAAARSRTVGEKGLMVGLGDYLRLLGGGRGVTVRHRSLRSVVDWSHDLLDDEEQMLFRRLAGFAGGFDIEAVTAVTGIATGPAVDLLGRLADKSLLTAVDAGGRWQMPATIRAYALDQLRHSADYVDTVTRHRDWAMCAVEELRTRLDGDWNRDFDAVADDLRAALSGMGAGQRVLRHRLARGLGQLTFARGFFTEAEAHYLAAAQSASHTEAALTDSRNAAAAALKLAGRQPAAKYLLTAAEHAGPDANVCAQALALAVTMTHRYSAERTDMTAQRTAELLAAAQRLAEGTGEPATRAMIATARAWSAAPDTAQPAPDAELAQAALAAARDCGDPVLILGALDAAGVAAANSARLREAYEIMRQRLPLLAELPRHEPYAEAETFDALLMVAALAVGVADYSELLDGAQPFIEESKLLALSCMGQFAETVQAAQYLWERWVRNGSPPMRWMATQAAAATLVHGLLGAPAEATWRDRTRMIARVGDGADQPFLAAIDAYVNARLAIHRGTSVGSEELVRRAVAELPEPWYAPYARVAGIELAVVIGLPTAAGLLREAEPLRNVSDWAAAGVLRAEGRLTGDLRMFAQAAELYERIGARFERACTLLLLPDRTAEARAELSALGTTVPDYWNAPSR